MLRQESGPLPYFVFPELEEIPHFTHAIFGRQALPTDYTDALQVLEIPPANLVRIRQVHSDRVVTPEEAAGEIPDADGIILAQPGRFSLIKTADCVPILVVNPQLRHVILVHAGWRGTRSRVLSRAIERYLGEAPGHPDADQLIVAFGPAIRQCCYEVGSEVREAFEKQGFAVESLFRGRMLDLVKASRQQAESLGVGKFIDSRICTACTTDLFYSYRKEGTDDRILTFAGFREG